MKTLRGSFTRIIGAGLAEVLTLLFSCLPLLITQPSSAAVLSWNGGGSSGKWSDSGNWGLAGTPGPGDTLIFISGALRPSNTNDVVGLQLSQIRFAGTAGGYSIFGNAFSLTNSIAATNTTGLNTINNDLTLSGGTNTFLVGGGASLSLLGSIGGSAALIKDGGGTLGFGGSTANTYTNTTLVNAGTLQLSKSAIDSALHGPLIIGDDIGGVNADVVHLGAGEQMNDQIPVTIKSSGLLDLAGTGEFFGSLSGSGNLYLNGGTPRIGVNGTSTTFDGLIVGVPGIIKNGSGTLTLNGNNLYPSTQINAGAVLINGFQPTNTVLVFTGGTIGGSGTVGIISCSSGNISPGNNGSGTLSCSNILMDASSALKIDLNGSFPGVGYDSLNVSGTNNLGGATLSLNPGSPFYPTVDLPLTILANDLSDPITGTFAGAAEGSLISVGSLKFRISYAASGGNDITLTLTNPPANAIGYALSGGNGNSFLDFNECNDFFLTITNTTGAPLTGISAKLTSLTAGIAVAQPFSAYPDVAASGIASNLSPFQLIAETNWPCGFQVRLLLSLSTSAGKFSVPFTFSSASVFPAQRFSYVVSTNILDHTTNDLPLVVSGISNAIIKATVSVYLNHTFDSDLSLILYGPNGASAELSSNNGSSGDNYGTDCDAGATFFDDAAATSITNGAAPFVGTFRPETPLSVFGGLSGSDVNGTWKLRVIDSFTGDTGNLKCWSLYLSQLSCPNGGGVCPLCPNTIIAGVISDSSQVQSDRLTRDFTASTCAAPKFCPGPVFHGGTLYEGFTFQNGPSNACINVSLNAPGTDLFSAAYLYSFDGGDLCTNYLADSGGGNDSFPGKIATYSFVAPSNSTFVVTVNSIDGTAGAFELTVSGGDCRPSLNISRPAAAQVKLDWPQSAGGYVLESTPSLTVTNWSKVPQVPAMVGGRYAVTNSLGTNNFYRLHKSF